MSESFGARLRQRREERNIALSTIAEQTKIKLSLLEGLERDDLSRWPSGIYRRAYIRAYGQAIGLCPDTVVREFLDAYPDPVEIIPALRALESDTSRTDGGPPTRLRNLVGAAIGSLSRLRRNAEGEDVPGGPAPIVSEPADPQPSPDYSFEPEIIAPLEAAEADDTSPIADPSPDAPASSAPDPIVAGEPVATAPDLMVVAELCTALGRVENAEEVQVVLEVAANVLDARGLIVWVWDAIPEELRPALAHGYPDSVITQLPAVTRDADNATAEAFRLAQTCAVEGSDGLPGALVVPLLTAGGCAGVLALELRHGGEKSTSVRAVATILAAVLAQLVGGARSSAAQSPSSPTEDAQAPGFYAKTAR